MDVTRAIKEQFDAAGISIPYPQTDVHIHQKTPEIKELQTSSTHQQQKAPGDQFGEMDTMQDE